MENLNIEQREQALREIEILQKKRVLIGKRIVFLIASINIVMTIIYAVMKFNLLLVIIQIVLSISLFFGVTWVRYFMAVVAALDSLRSLLTLIVIVGNSPVWIIIFLFLFLAFNFSSCILLFTNKCVSEFLYFQKNG